MPKFLNRQFVLSKNIFSNSIFLYGRNLLKRIVIDENKSRLELSTV